MVKEHNFFWQVENILQEHLEQVRCGAESVEAAIEATNKEVGKLLIILDPENATFMRGLLESNLAQDLQDFFFFTFDVEDEGEKLYGRK